MCRSCPWPILIMLSRNLVEFLLLAAIWGASFLCMRIAAPELGAIPVALLRCAIGAMTLLVVLVVIGQCQGLREHALTTGLIGLVNSAIPFVLLGYATLTLTAGITSVLNSLAPLWAAVVAFYWLGDRLTRQQAVGLALGVIGVSVLVGGAHGAGDAPDFSTTALAFGAGVLATVAYGFGANMARLRTAGINPLVVATGSQIGATLALLIPGIASWPDKTPTDVGLWWAIGALGIVCTGLAYLLFFRLVASVGATRTVAVTFVIPVFGIAWGMLLLDEMLTPLIVLGAVIVVLGTILTTVPGITPKGITSRCAAALRTLRRRSR